MKFSKLLITIVVLTGIVWAAIIVLNGKSFHTINWRVIFPLIGLLIFLGISKLKDYVNFSMSIKKGVDLINNGNAWNTRYLIIIKNPANKNEILVTNDLLWIEESNKKNYSEEILLKMLVSDFEKIAKKSKMKNFLQNRKVIFKLNEHR